MLKKDQPTIGLKVLEFRENYTWNETDSHYANKDY